MSRATSRDDGAVATVSSECVERGRGRARRSTRGGLVCGAQSGVDGPGRREYRRPHPVGCAGLLRRTIRTDLAHATTVHQGEGHRNEIHARLRLSSTGSESPGRRVVAGDALLNGALLIAASVGRQGPRLHSARGDDCHFGARRHVGYRRRAPCTAEDGWVWTFAAVDQPGTPSAWAGMCARWGTASRPS